MEPNVTELVRSRLKVQIESVFRFWVWLEQIEVIRMS